MTTNNNNSPVYELPTNVYGPSDNTPFNVPAATYGVPVPATSAYSTSVSDWVSSSTSYQPPPSGLPPKPVYGPPPPGAPNTIIYDHGRPVYVPAGGPTIHQVYYGHSGPPAAGWEGPRESFWLLDKLKFKLDFFTIGKILLKLIIFKKIVKFIALICLLLFLPKLQALSASGDSEKDVDALDESRQFSVKCKLPNKSLLRKPHRTDSCIFCPTDDLNARINETTTFALTAMDAFARKYPDECAGPTDILCRLGKVMDAVDERYPYKMIVAMYLPKNDEIASNEIA